MSDEALMGRILRRRTKKLLHSYFAATPASSRGVAYRVLRDAR